jgi:tetratricopeptide (TPR) repeat protein
MIESNTKEMLNSYEEGLAFYKQRKFSEAKKCFEKAISFVPNDGPSKLYINRCEEYMENPPPDDWDGVYIMKTK